MVEWREVTNTSWLVVSDSLRKTSDSLSLALTTLLAAATSVDALCLTHSH